MFGLRFKKPYREYEYSRFSEEEQTTCIVYERQYNSLMDMGGFGVFGIILYHILIYVLKFDYSSDTMFVVFIFSTFIRLLMIIEKNKK